MYIVHCDGSYREQYKSMAIGVYIFNSNTGNISRISRVIGEGSPESLMGASEAEFYAVIDAVENLINMKCCNEKILINTDSRTVVDMFNSDTTIGNKRLKKLCSKLRKRTSQFHKLEIQWIPRRKNKVADKLCYEAFKSLIKENREKNRPKLLEKRIREIRIAHVKGETYKALSSKKDIYYEVDLNSNSCTCRYFIYNRKVEGIKCKHIIAAERYKLAQSNL